MHDDTLTLFTRFGAHHIGTINRDPSGPADKTSYFVVREDIHDALRDRTHPITPIHQPDATDHKVWELRMCGHRIGFCSTAMLHDLAAAFRVDMPEGEPDTLADDIRNATLGLLDAQAKLAAAEQKVRDLYAAHNARDGATLSARARDLGTEPFLALRDRDLISFSMRATGNTNRPEIDCIVTGWRGQRCLFTCTNGGWDGTLELAADGRLMMTLDQVESSHAMAITAINRMDNTLS